MIILITVKAESRNLLDQPDDSLGKTDGGLESVAKSVRL